jgi:Tfp pilus assembly protein PilN
VRAVNLIPGDQRRGGGTPGRSGSAAHVVLGALAVLLVGVVVYVLSANQVTSRKAEVAKTNTEAASLEQQAAALRPYKDFATLSQTRVQTVASLAASRFDWERALRELARALPGDVWLTSLSGTVSPGVSIESAGSGGSTGSLRSALQVPAIEIVGCTESQARVSSVMSRLRTMKGVQRVSLGLSEKSESAGGGGAAGAAAAGGQSGGASNDCRNGSGRFPQFELVVFFKAPAGATAAPGQGATPPQGGAPQGAAPQGGQAVSQPASTGAGK